MQCCVWRRWWYMNPIIRYGGGGPSSVPLYGGGGDMTPSSVTLYGGGGGMSSHLTPPSTITHPSLIRPPLHHHTSLSTTPLHHHTSLNHSFYPQSLLLSSITPPILNYPPSPSLLHHHTSLSITPPILHHTSLLHHHLPLHHSFHP